MEVEATEMAEAESDGGLKQGEDPGEEEQRNLRQIFEAE